MAKVRGIGGIFFKNAGKGSKLAAWYYKNLGLRGRSTANADSKCFSPSGSSFMVNYGVDNMNEKNKA